MALRDFAGMAILSLARQVALISDGIETRRLRGGSISFIWVKNRPWPTSSGTTVTYSDKEQRHPPIHKANKKLKIQRPIALAPPLLLCRTDEPPKRALEH